MYIDPGLGEGTNCPGSKVSLNGHGVVLLSQFHRRRDRDSLLSKVTLAASRRLRGQAPGASPLHALCRRKLRGRGRRTPRLFHPPLPRAWCRPGSSTRSREGGVKLRSRRGPRARARARPGGEVCGRFHCAGPEGGPRQAALGPQLDRDPRLQRERRAGRPVGVEPRRGPR